MSNIRIVYIFYLFKTGLRVRLDLSRNSCSELKDVGMIEKLGGSDLFSWASFLYVHFRLNISLHKQSCTSVILEWKEALPCIPLRLFFVKPSLPDCDILLLIQILGFVRWITDLAPDPIRILLFLAVTFKMPVNKKEFFEVSCLFLTVGTLTSVFKDNMSLRSHKTVEIMVYLNFWLVDERYK